MNDFTESMPDQRDGEAIPIGQVVLEVLCSAELESACRIKTTDLAVLTPRDFDLLQGTVRVPGHAGPEQRFLPEQLKRELEDYLAFYSSPRALVFDALDKHFEQLIQNYIT